MKESKASLASIPDSIILLPNAPPIDAILAAVLAVAPKSFPAPPNPFAIAIPGIIRDNVVAIPSALPAQNVASNIADHKLSDLDCIVL